MSDSLQLVLTAIRAELTALENKRDVLDFIDVYTPTVLMNPNNAKRHIIGDFVKWLADDLETNRAVIKQMAADLLARRKS